MNGHDFTRTGDGKTTWMTNLAVGASNLGAMGLFVTLEEPRFQIRAKMLACYSVLSEINFSSEWLETWQALNVINGKNKHKSFLGFMKDISANCRIIDANRDHGGPIEASGMFYTPQYLADLVDFYNAETCALWSTSLFILDNSWKASMVITLTHTSA